MTILDGTVIASSAADIWSTEAALRVGLEETNPFFRSRWSLYALKGGGAIFVSIAGRHLRRDGSRTWWLPQVLWTGVNLAAARHNLLLSARAAGD